MPPLEERVGVSRRRLPNPTGKLEQYHWFSGHLESADGTLLTAGVSDEKTAARRGKR
ncbi:hypothetical protein Areg01_22000 [Actinoplanes regularis]|nr:hypothetical protein Areg01_22000 [Actinoplanes regularis]